MESFSLSQCRLPPEVGISIEHRGNATFSTPHRQGLLCPPQPLTLGEKSQTPCGEDNNPKYPRIPEIRPHAPGYFNM